MTWKLTSNRVRQYVFLSTFSTSAGLSGAASTTVCDWVSSTTGDNIGAVNSQWDSQDVNDTSLHQQVHGQSLLCGIVGDEWIHPVQCQLDVPVKSYHSIMLQNNKLTCCSIVIKQFNTDIIYYFSMVTNKKAVTTTLHSSKSKQPLFKHFVICNDQHLQKHNERRET